MKVLIVRVGRPISAMDISDDLVQSGYLRLPVYTGPKVIMLERQRFAIGHQVRPVFVEMVTNPAQQEQLKRRVNDWLAELYDRAVEGLAP